MGIVALVVLSITVAWSMVVGGFNPSGNQRARTMYSWTESGRALSRMHAYVPPVRKSIVVDTTGMAHPTADRTGMTKRDRSRLYPTIEIQEKVYESQQTAAVPPPAVVMAPAPLHQMQTEEMPLMPPAPPKPAPAQPERELSLGRKVQMALMADNTLSRSAQLTVKAASFRNKVTLRGIVLDKEEKEYVGTKAGQIAGPENVDNRLTVL